MLLGKPNTNKGNTQDIIPSVHNEAYGRITGAGIMNVRASENVAYGLVCETSQNTTHDTSHVYDVMDFDYI